MSVVIERALPVPVEEFEEDPWVSPLVPIYEIDVDQFKRNAAPKVPQVYTFPDKVSRANYASFLVDDFRFSMGVPQVQYARHIWMYLNQGFQYSATEANFFEAGGFLALSKDERSMIREAYLAVGRHSAFRVSYRDMNETFASVLDDVEGGGFEGLPITEQMLLGMPADEVRSLLVAQRTIQIKEARSMYTRVEKDGEVYWILKDEHLAKMTGK